MKLGELLEALKQTYCGPIGAEYMHITSTEENADPTAYRVWSRDFQ